MSDKYYIPELEEFSVGFEFECKPWIRGSGRSNEWIKSNDFSESCFIEDSDSVSILNDAISMGFIRVKYLDKEDIISCGFILKQDREYPKEYNIIDKSGAILGNFIPEENCNIELFNSYFIVKNKSEFKKLLKQLNIK